MWPSGRFWLFFLGRKRQEVTGSRAAGTPERGGELLCRVQRRQRMEMNHGRAEFFWKQVWIRERPRNRRRRSCLGVGVWPVRHIVSDPV
jgi:hypothetical protein